MGRAGVGEDGGALYSPSLSDHSLQWLNPLCPSCVPPCYHDRELPLTASKRGGLGSCPLHQSVPCPWAARRVVHECPSLPELALVHPLFPASFAASKEEEEMLPQEVGRAVPVPLGMHSPLPSHWAKEAWLDWGFRKALGGVKGWRQLEFPLQLCLDLRFVLFFFHGNFVRLRSGCASRLVCALLFLCPPSPAPH